MNELIRNHYKDRLPHETIADLQSILRNIGIEVEEQWVDESCIETYSLRLNLKGTTRGANGKGVTKEYARASAYAELIERYQNGILINPRYIPYERIENNYLVAADEQKMKAEELVHENSPFLKMYFQQRNMDSISKAEKIKSFQDNNKMDLILTGEQNNYTVVPFYSIKEDRVYNLPYWIYSMYYGSNGMVAGNTPEEAVVQGLSEIFERYVHKQLFSLTAGLPSVPEEVLKKYPDLYEKIKTIRKIDNLELEILDCSLGGKYPVVGMLIWEKNTGNYGVKLGCHPCFEVALERTLTEAAQGTDITDYVNRSTVDFFNTDVTSWINMTNSYKIGLSQYPYQLFSKKVCFEYSDEAFVIGKSNRQLCKVMISKLINEGYDVLIRDVSTLGFPSYHIIVPNFSEMIDASDDKIRAQNTRIFTSGLLQNPTKITAANCKYIIAALGYYSKSILECGLDSYYQDAADLHLPYHEFGVSSIYLAAMCNVMVGDYIEAYKRISGIEKVVNYMEPKSEKSVRISAIGKYCSGMAVINSHESVMEYMKKLFDENICFYINELFETPENVIIKQFPSVEEITNSAGAMELAYKYADILKREQILHPIDQMRIGEFVKENM